MEIDETPSVDFVDGTCERIGASPTEFLFHYDEIMQLAIKAAIFHKLVEPTAEGVAFMRDDHEP